MIIFIWNLKWIHSIFLLIFWIIIIFLIFFILDLSFVLFLNLFVFLLILVQIIRWLSLVAIVAFIQVSFRRVLTQTVILCPVFLRIFRKSHISLVWIQRLVWLLVRVCLNRLISICWVFLLVISWFRFLFSLSKQNFIFFAEIIIIAIYWDHRGIKRPKVVVHIHLSDLFLLHAALTLLAQNIAKRSRFLLAHRWCIGVS